jgi:hypothetical protein
MSNWRAYLNGDPMAVGTQIDFMEEGGVGGNLRPDDTLAVVYPNNRREPGTVVSTEGDMAVIKVVASSWKIRRLGNHASRTQTWIVESPA